MDSESILTLIKKNIGIEEEDNSFDSEIITHINSVFFELSQLGVGPPEGFSIHDSSTTWGEYVKENENLNALKSYMVIRVRLLFDPPQNSFTIASLKEQAKEYEWRLNVQAESSK